MRAWYCIVGLGLAACTATGCLGIMGDFEIGDASTPDAAPDATVGDAGRDAPALDGGTDVLEDVSADVSGDASDAAADADAGEACAPPPLMVCNGTCVNTDNAKDNCGGCNNLCLDGNGTASCQGSKCVCNANYSYCATGCVDETSDNANCGACNSPCQGGMVCTNSACKCPASKPSFCANMCVDTSSDNANCGACNSPCQGGTFCTNFVCTCPASKPSLCANVCVDTSSDNANCGACNRACGQGATCTAGKCRVSVTGSQPWGLGIGPTSGAVYWTEFGTASIRRCSTTTGCATLPPALYTGTAGSSLPAGIVAAKASDNNEYYYNTDNQCCTNNTLWRTLNDGTGRTNWGGTTMPGGPGAIVTDGVNLWWGTSGGVYRTGVNTNGATHMLNANPSPATGTTPQAVANDSTKVYAIRTTSPTGVVACAATGDCSSTGEVQIISGGSYTNLVSDGTNVYIAQQTSAGDFVFKCPTSGCSGSPTPYASITTSGGSQPTGIAVDSTYVYFSSRQHAIVYCNKTSGCANQTTLVNNASPVMLILYNGYLYWTEQLSGGGIFRVPVP